MMIPCEMKDHEIAKLVNDIRDVAIKYRNAQQLREQLARIVVPTLRGVRSPEKKEPSYHDD